MYRFYPICPKDAPTMEIPEQDFEQLNIFDYEETCECGNCKHAIKRSQFDKDLIVDASGLKVVNDREGHAAGDAKLVEAAEALKKVFYDEDLFRTGGDEFIIISSDVNRKKFEEKVERLRRSVEKNSDLSFAMGSYWSEGQEDVTASFRRADEKMYADKEAFYEHHPQLRRDYREE
jgi:diguanylate cyclase (GGDEF)-like protein